MESRIHQDTFIGLFIMIFCGVVYLIAEQYPSGVKMLPNICLTIIFLLACRITYEGTIKTKRAKVQEPITNSLFYKNLIVPVKAYLYIVGYFILFYLVGYFIATTIFMIAIMRHLSVKSWKQIILVTLIFAFVLYLLFVRQFNVPVLNLGHLGMYFGIY